MLKIQAEAAPGDEIRSTAKEAQRVADLTGCIVEFRFNGVACLASPGGCAEQLADQQQAEMGRPEILRRPRVAYSRKAFG